MRCIIAGGRDYWFTAQDTDRLDFLSRGSRISEVVCGGAPGADEGGKQWAISRGILVKVFPADWAKYGRAAGPIRNEEMAKYADMCVLFPGGRGTASMRALAKKYDLALVDVAALKGLS